MMRPDGRTPEQIRPLVIELRPVRYPPGSALIRWGDTHVLCTVSVESQTPKWLESRAQGWLTAEYALLPGATQSRTPRSHISGGRAHEIQRLIGRSLRRAVDLSLLPNLTLTVDCDVLQADGGTRTAAITGSYVALAIALHQLHEEKGISLEALMPPVAAISVGVIEGEVMTDLCYVEDSHAEMDLNVVMDDQERFIEVQGTAEGAPVSRARFDELLNAAECGIRELTGIQRQVLADAGIVI